MRDDTEASHERRALQIVMDRFQQGRSRVACLAASSSQGIALKTFILRQCDKRPAAGVSAADHRRFRPRSTRERVWPDLQLEHLRLSVDAAFAMEVGAGAGGGPQASALPAAVRIVDAAVGILCEEAHRIRNPQGNELAVNDSGERFAAVR